MPFLYLWIFAHAITAAIVGLIALTPVKAMLTQAGVVKTNFRQREVVNVAGVLVIIVWVFLVALAITFSFVVNELNIFVPEGFVLAPDVSLPLTVIIIGAGLFGLIDDLLGNRESTGFKGHIGAIFRGKLTTGGLKAIGITAVAVLSVALLSSSLIEVIGNALLIALFVNTMNLLDLRPGRALKVYIPLQLFFVFASYSAFGTSSAALVGLAAVMLGPDLREEIMLGDTGSNILGGVLGFFTVATFDWNVKLPLIAVLLLLQLLTEKYSITAVIERVPVLRVLDNLGRKVE